MELRGNLGVINGEYHVGKHCVSCEEYYVDKISMDDFDGQVDLKDDLCFECLIEKELIPAQERYMANTQKEIQTLLDTIHAQQDVIADMHTAIDLKDELIRHKDLEIMDLKKELECQKTSEADFLM